MHFLADKQNRQEQQTPRHQMDHSARFSYTKRRSSDPCVGLCAIATGMRMCLLPDISFSPHHSSQLDLHVPTVEVEV